MRDPIQALAEAIQQQQPAGLVVANLVIPAEQATTPFTQVRRAMQEKYLAEITQRFAVPVVQIPLLPNEVKGVKMLAELGKTIFREANEDADHPIGRPIFDSGSV
jgi:arsenite-transporting ATPase